MLKITTAFKNKIPTANLIFRDDDNKGVNLIYFPELPNKGISFINMYRKKNYWDYIIVPPTFTFMGKKILTMSYYKEIRTAIPQIRVQKKFIKANKELHSIVVDISPLAEQFTTFIKTRSKKNTTEFFFDLVNQLAKDSINNTGKDVYLIIDSNNTDEKVLVDAIFYLSKLNSNKFRNLNIKGIVAYGNNRFWPLTIEESDQKGNFLKINLNIITRYFKEVHGKELDEVKVDKQTIIKETREQVEKLYNLHNSKKKSLSSEVSKNLSQKEDVLVENPLEAIRHTINSNHFLSGKTFKEKLENLYKETEVSTKEKDQTEKPEISKKDLKKIEEIDSDLKKLNKKYNGVIEVDPNRINKSASAFYKPLDIIGFNDFHAYNRQSTEFDDNLDEAMHDLIMSLEKDKELGIKVLGIQSEITDNYKDRFKTYKIKIQHKDFGKTKPYTVKFHIPYPAQGKYLKLNGNNFIATNQFFPKPVVKIKPNLVRIYTHYATAAISLKRHIISEQQGFEKIADDFGKKLTAAKKIKDKVKKLDPEDVQFLKDKYNLPDNISPDLFMEMTIKDA